MISINNNPITLEKLTAALDGLSQDLDNTTIDKVFTLEDETNPLGMRKGSPQAKGLFNRKVTKAKTGTDSTPVSNFKRNLALMLKASLSSKAENDNQLKTYLHSVGQNLLGKNLEQNLEIGTLKQLLVKAKAETHSAMLRKYLADDDPRVVGYRALSAELTSLVGRLPAKNDKLKEQIKALLEGTNRNIESAIRGDLENGNTDAGNIIGVSLEAFVYTGTQLRDAMLQAIFDDRKDQKLAAFGKMAEDAGVSFQRDWEALDESVRKNLTEGDKADVLDALKKHADVFSHKVAQLKPGASGSELDAALRELDEMFATAANELELLSAECLDKVTRAASEREQAINGFLLDCEKETAQQKQALKVAMQDLITRWQDMFGAYDADVLAGGLKKLEAAQAELDKAFQKAREDGVLRKDEMTDALRKRLDESHKAVVEKCKTAVDEMTNLVDTLVAAEEPKFAAYSVARQKEAIRDLAQKALDVCRTTLEDKVRTAGSDSMKESLTTVLADLDKLVFSEPTADEDVKAVKARYLGLVESLNVLYRKAELDPIDAQKKRFETDLDAAVTKFKNDAETLVANFLRSWDEKFGAVQGKEKEIVDANRDAIIGVLRRQIAPLAEEAAFDVRNSSKLEMILTPELEKKFDDALEKLKDQANAMLAKADGEVAGYSEALTDYNTAIAAYEKTKALLVTVNTWQFQGRADMIDFNGFQQSATQLYLNDFFGTFVNRVEELRKSVGRADVLSRESLKGVSQTLNDFCGKIEDAITRAGSDPEKLMRLLRAIPMPKLVVKTVARSIVDGAVVEGVGGDIEFEADEAPGEAVTLGLQRFSALVKQAQDDLNGLLQRIAVPNDMVNAALMESFRELVREVHNEMVQEVKDVLAGEHGDELLAGGIGKIVRQAWNKVSAYVDELKNEASQRLLAAKADDVLKALRDAKETVPDELLGEDLKPKEKARRQKLLLTRQHTLTRAEVAVERYVKLVGHQLVKIRRNGGVPSSEAFARILLNLDAMMKWVDGDPDAEPPVSAYKNNVNPGVIDTLPLENLMRAAPEAEIADMKMPLDDGSVAEITPLTVSLEDGGQDEFENVTITYVLDPMLEQAEPQGDLFGLFVHDCGYSFAA